MNRCRLEVEFEFKVVLVVVVEFEVEFEGWNRFWLAVVAFADTGTAAAVPVVTCGC